MKRVRFDKFEIITVIKILNIFWMWISPGQELVLGLVVASDCFGWQYDRGKCGFSSQTRDQIPASSTNLLCGFEGFSLMNTYWAPTMCQAHSISWTYSNKKDKHNRSLHITSFLAVTEPFLYTGIVIRINLVLIIWKCQLNGNCSEAVLDLVSFCWN